MNDGINRSRSNGHADAPLTRGEFTEAIGLLAKSFEQVATKKDLDRFASKDELAQFATKKDLQGFATKDDVANLATKDELKTLMAEIRSDLEEVKRHFEVVAEKFRDDITGANHDEIELIKDRLTRLEKLLGPERAI